MTILHILYWIAFIIMLVCFPAVNFIDVRRWYGRIFNTRIDTKIYNKIFYISIICVFILYIIIFIMR
jgi:hypothetical protein